MMDDNGKTKRVFGFVATRPEDLTIVSMMVVVTMCNFCAGTKEHVGKCAQTS